MSLTEKRKADRQKMADALVVLAKELNAEAFIDPEWTGWNPREIMVCIKANGGLCLNVDFSGTSSQPDVYVLSWHMDTKSDNKLQPNFTLSVNNYHFRKATDIGEGFEDMCRHVFRGLQKVQDGTAYQ